MRIVKTMCIIFVWLFMEAQLIYKNLKRPKSGYISLQY